MHEWICFFSIYGCFGTFWGGGGDWEMHWVGVKKNVRFFYQGMTNNVSMTLSECVFISSFVVCFLFSGGGGGCVGVGVGCLPFLICLIKRPRHLNWCNFCLLEILISLTLIWPVSALTGLWNSTVMVISTYKHTIIPWTKNLSYCSMSHAHFIALITIACLFVFNMNKVKIVLHNKHITKKKKTALSIPLFVY